MIKGMGKCLIAKNDGVPCGMQIQEGEAIGTVMSNFGGPLVGHKRCADAYHQRVQKSEREKKEELVKQVSQTGPGGPIDMSKATDALAFGSVPLEQRPGKAPAKTEPVSTLPTGDIEGQLPALEAAIGIEGVVPITTVPLEGEEEEKSPSVDDEVEDPPSIYASREEIADFVRRRRGRSEPALVMASDTLPQVDARNGKVVIKLMNVESRLFIEDAEDLYRLLAIQIGRARRQNNALA